jgi:hypothetical protein
MFSLLGVSVLKLMIAGLKVGDRGREIKTKRDLSIVISLRHKGGSSRFFSVSDGCSDELAKAACERGISGSIEAS